jgi:homogentisate 1,2-dioxygenase
MFQYRQGRPTRHSHKGIPESQFEEEQGHLGFFGPVSHLIKTKPSTRWIDIEGPLRPHMFDLVQLRKSPTTQRLLFNSEVTLSMTFVDAVSGATPSAARNVDGDLLFFCHKGHGHIFSEYGLLTYRPGHYILIPKSLTYAIVPSEPSQFFTVENRKSHFQQPERGILGRHGLYDQNAIGVPNLDELHDLLKKRHLDFRQVEVKRLDETTRFKYETCIFADVVGWKGDLFPTTLHVDDFMPVMSHRAHLPPSIHSTFVARDFIVCTFLPRPLESDADALKVPFFHQNIDYDEVIFYHDGDFFSRDNLHAGMMSFHPAGFPHGPHPKAFKSAGNKTHTNEYAVMVDSRWPLQMDPAVEAVELKQYWQSWKG